MSEHTLSPENQATYDVYTKTTNRWGSITMGMAFLLATYLPFHIMLFTDVPVTFTQVLVGFAVVAAVYGIFWVLEPITYFPILGPAGMYQAFMIGNISNKLLPAAIVAQSAVGVKPGTRKGSLVATTAICGAAFVHVASLIIFVCILGTWIVSALPPMALEVTQIYILPAILGGVLVQLIVTLKNVRSTLIATAVALVMALIVLQIPGIPPALRGFNVAICVVVTVTLVWFTRNRARNYSEDDAEGIG